MLAPLAPWAARHVGADKHAAVIERANGTFGGGEVPADREERQRALAEVDHDALAALDEEFWALEDDDDGRNGLQPHMAAYVRAHPEEFFVA